MAKFATPFGFSAEGFVPGGEAGLNAFSALPGYEQRFIREQGRSPTSSERETGVYDVTPRDLFAPNIFAPQPGTEYRFNMPVSPPMLKYEDNTYQVGLSPEIEARIQQDASRGLFDVNERSVAQLGPLTGQSNWKPFTGTSKLIVDALTGGPLTGDPADMERGRADYERRQAREKAARLKTQRLFKFGGRLGIGLGGGLWSGGLSEGVISEQRDENPNSPTFGQIRKDPSSYFDFGGDQDFAGMKSPVARFRMYGGGQPITTPLASGALTPQELFKQRNDAEDVRLRGAEDPGLWDRFRGFFGRSSDPNIPDRPLWNPISAAGASTAPTSPDVIFNPPPVVPPISREQEIENMMTQDRIKQLDYLPGGSLYKAPFEQGTGPMASQVSQALADAAYGRPVQEELQSLAQLSKTDPGIAKRYVPGSQALQDITSQVESFADIPAVQPGAEKPWTPPAPAVPDISEILKTYVPPPAAQEPYVEQFEEITPPKKVVKKKVKKKVKKAKPGPKKAKVKAKVSKAPPRRVKYTPPKPKPAPRRVKYTPPEDPFAFEDRRGGRR